jgi:hypothetical protein
MFCQETELAVNPAGKTIACRTFLYLPAMHEQ